MSWLWTGLTHYASLLTGATCLVLGYLLIWQRGFYSDDYIHKHFAIDLTTGKWRPFWTVRFPDFPVRIVSWVVMTTLAGLMPTHEFFVRALLALGVGLNALLLGWLVYRILGSNLAAVISGWLFVAPFYTQEATLWVGAESYIFGGTLGLVFLHASWIALTEPQRARRMVVIAWLAFADALFLIEPFMLVAAWLPIFGLIRASQRADRRFDWASFRRSLYLLLGPLGIAALFYLVLYRGSNLVQGRGGFDLNPVTILRRARYFLDIFNQITIGKFGQQITADVFDIGLDTLAHSPVGLTLLIAASVLLLLTLLTWQKHEGEYNQSYRIAALVFGGGLILSVFALFFPGTLIKDQGPAPRLLYLPASFAVVAVGALSWLVAKWRKSRLWDKTFVALTGILLLLSTICLVGYTRVYQARNQLDRRQIEALVRAVPSMYLPVKSTVVVFNTNEHPFGKKMRVDDTVNGVFESSWSGLGALAEAYRREDLSILTGTRWGAPTFSVLQHQGSEVKLQIGYGRVFADRTVLVRYSGNNAFPIEQLTIYKSDGSKDVIRFPIAANLHQHGLPTIDNFVVASQ